MVAITKQSSVTGRVLAGRYRVEEVLGRGAMGSVYRAVDQQSNRVCAIKLMHQFATLDERAYLRFVHEAQIVAQLYHPNIVEVWGFDRDEDGTPILAMELLQGQDLHSLISAEPLLPVPRVLEIVRAVGGALHAAHSAGVLHRDIKPKNIFLSRVKNSRGEEIEVVKVVDFGLSKVLGMHHVNETAPGTILGTAEYVAPETTLGMPELIDFRADQWALGVVAYRLISGRLPFEASDVIALLLTIRQGKAPPLRELLARRIEPVPEHIIAAVERTMAKNKDERFETIQDFLRALDGLPPVGHLLSMSSDGMPSMGTPDWAKRNLAAASLTDLGRISLSGAVDPPASAASGRHAPSSLSARGAPSAISTRQAPSAMTGKPLASAISSRSVQGPMQGPMQGHLQGESISSGRLLLRSTAIGLGPMQLADVAGAASRGTPKAGMLSAAPPDAIEEPSVSSSRSMPRTAAEAASAFAPLLGHGGKSAASQGKRLEAHVEPSAEYSVHVSGHLVNGNDSHPAASAKQPAKSRVPAKILAPVIAAALLFLGLLWVSVSRRAPSPPASPSEPAAEALAVPTLPVAATVASPTGISPPPSPPPALVPAAAAPESAPGQAAGTPAPASPSAPATAPSIKPAAPHPPPAHLAKSWHPGAGGRLGAKPGANQAAHHAQAPAAAAKPAGAGQQATSPSATAENKPASPASAPAAPALQQPKDKDKDAEMPKRITVVD